MRRAEGGAFHARAFCASVRVKAPTKHKREIYIAGGQETIMAHIVNLFGYHTITFDTQGGAPVKPMHKKRSQLVIMPKAEKPGCLFGGWYFDKACTRPAVISTMPRENVKVYAKWNVPLPFTPEAEKRPQVFLPAEAASVPHPKSFLKQLKEGSNANKETFTELCGYMLGFRGVRVRYTRREALFRHKKQELLRAIVRGNTLRIYFNLDPDAYEQATYHHRRTEKRWAVKTPFELVVRSNRSRKYAMRLAEDVMRKAEIEPKRSYTPLDYRTYVLARGGNALTKAGKGELIVERINVQDVGVLTDGEARSMAEIKRVPPQEGESKIVSVSVSTLSEHFADGVRVNLASLRRKNLVAEDATGFRVVGKNTLERSLVVTANAFNANALKMILLTGGRAIVLQEDESLAPKE